MGLDIYPFRTGQYSGPGLGSRRCTVGSRRLTPKGPPLAAPPDSVLKQ